MLTQRPLVKFCIPFVVGIFIGWNFEMPIAYSVGVAVVFALLSLLLSRLQPGSLFPTLFLYALIVAFGIAKISFDTRYRSENSIERFLDQDQDSVQLQGVIEERAIAKKKIVTFIVRTESVTIGAQSFPADGQVLALISNQRISNRMIHALNYGTVVYLQGVLQLPPSPRNPGEFDYRTYLQLHDIHAQLSIRDEKNISLGGVSGNPLLRTIVYPTREWIGSTLDNLVGGEEAKFLKGIVIGERSEIAPEIKSAFFKTGLMHLLAISGFHVGVVALILFAICSTLRLPKGVEVLLISIGLVFFIFLTGARPSTVRAVIMAMTILIGRFFQEKVDLYNVVAFAAVVQLLIDARTLFDIGFQLSFAAVIAIAYFYPKFRLQFERLPERLKENIVLKYTLAAFAVSLAASVGTMPLVAYYFHIVSVVGLLLNLVAIPLSGLILSLAITAVAAAAISTWLGAVYSSAAYILSSGLLTLTSWSSTLPFAYIEKSLSLPWVVASYFALLLIVNIQKQVARKILIVGVLVVVNGLLYASLLGVFRYDLRITVLDVGQGDAIFVEFPDGKNLLLDAGPAGFGYDAGNRTILPFLKRKEITKIDKLLVSHPHADHCGGVPSILRSIKVDEYIGEEYTKSLLTKEIRHVVDSLHLPMRHEFVGRRIDGYNNARLYVLHPSEEIFTQTSANLNNHSIVLKLVYGKTSILFPGDAEKEVEREMTNIYGNFLDSDILKVGHHGSNTSSTVEFLSQVKPSLAIISVGKRNKYRHPSPEILERLKAMNVRTYRTDERGAVVLESDGKSWKVIEWK